MDPTLEKALREFLAPPRDGTRTAARNNLVDVVLNMFPDICRSCLGNGIEQYAESGEKDECRACHGKGCITLEQRLEDELKSDREQVASYQESIALYTEGIAKLEQRLTDLRAGKVTT